MNFFRSIILIIALCVMVISSFAQESDSSKVSTNKVRGGAISKDTIQPATLIVADDTLKQKRGRRSKKVNKTDTLQLSPEDSLRAKNHTPKKAVLMSAIMPGLGQIYNRKYWKAPIVYALIGTGVYFIVSNRTQYLKVRRSYLARIDPSSGYVDEFPNATDNALLESIEFNRKNMELSYVGTALAYVLNLVDASVDAHLFHFDVSDDLSLRVSPEFSSPNLLLPGPSYSNTFSAGLTFTLKL